MPKRHIIRPVSIIASRTALATAAIGLFAVAGCLPPPSGPTPPPSPAQIFNPDPNHNFAANSGIVTINGLGGVGSVCYTTDGSAPMYNNGSCSGGSTEFLSGTEIALACDAGETGNNQIKAIKLVYNWPDTGETNASGNFILDCTPPPVDSDGDGIPDASDNCPNVANPGQEDSDGDGLYPGDACRNDPPADDADGDSRPDEFDNCPYVWNQDQADDDNDGIGNVCDSDPVEVIVPWANHSFLSTWNEWEQDIRCMLNNARNGNNNCTDPTGLDNSSINCPEGGTAVWTIKLVNFGGQTKFTYTNCQHTLADGTTLMVNGDYTGWFNASGSSTDARGLVNITGDYTGTIEDQTNIVSSVKTSGYFLVQCSADPLPNEDCAPNNLNVQFNAPAPYTCDGGICPEATPPLVDTDGDGVFDRYDNCPLDYNPDQANADFDSMGDVCDDSTSTEDADGDGIPDSGDNCPNDANTDQADADNDGIGDVCDPLYNPDSDGDGIVDDADNCPNDANPGQEDIDGDGIGDACDPQDDSWVMLKQKDGGRCLYVDGTEVKSSGNCDANNTAQQWRLIPQGDNVQLQNVQNGQCVSYEGRWIVFFFAYWGVTEACDSGNTKQQYHVEDYDQGGLDQWYPTRLRNVSLNNACLYTNNLDDVYQTELSCNLAGTQNYRKWGIYRAGDFNGTPLREADFPL